MKFSSLYFVLYGTLAISHILIQTFIGHFEAVKQRHRKYESFHSKHYEKVSVIIPSYNEGSVILDKCISSIVNQNYKDLDIIVIDDGSPNIESLRPIYNQYKKLRNVTVLMPRVNKGKRHIQKQGFDIVKGDIIVTVDSDTVLRDKFAISRMVRRFRDPAVGAVTGDVKVENKDDNLLTGLIHCRYWMAFHQERAAQSFFYVLMCCSGPFSAYRKSIIDQVKDKYVNQKFFGRICTYGDDRHLTNLVLETGSEVVFDRNAVAFTQVPTTLKQYMKQQLRWNKSFYREMLWTLKSFRRHHWYLIFDLVMQFILPFLLIVSLVITAVLTIKGNYGITLYYSFTLVGVAMLRSFYGMYMTKDKTFLIFSLYGFMHIFFLLPTRLYALATIKEMKWGTR